MTRHDRVFHQLADYAVGGLSRRARARVEAHLGQCAACRAELAALERTGRLVEQMGLDGAPPATWETVRRALPARPSPAPTPGARLTWRWAMGAAAVVLVALAALVLRPQATPPPPVPVVSAEIAEQELQATMQGHLSAVWSAPLSDGAAVGLRLASLEEGG